MGPKVAWGKKKQRLGQNAPLAHVPKAHSTQRRRLLLPQQTGPSGPWRWCPSERRSAWSSVPLPTLTRPLSGGVQTFFRLSKICTNVLRQLGSIPSESDFHTEVLVTSPKYLLISDNYLSNFINALVAFQRVLFNARPQMSRRLLLHPANSSQNRQHATSTDLRARSNWRTYIFERLRSKGYTLVYGFSVVVDGVGQWLNRASTGDF